MKRLIIPLALTLTMLLVVPLGLILLLTAVILPATAATACTPTGTTTSTSPDGMPPPGSPRQASLTNPPTSIPPDIQTLYQTAATHYGLPWTLLAGVGMEETNHGRNTATSSAGAQGLMQFMPGTWASYGVDGDNDGHASITNNADSIFSAANYLAASGATTSADGIRTALYAYNHALWYVNDVLYYAAAYTADGTGDITANPCITDTTSSQGGTVTGTGPASSAVNAALRWLGTPYSWGGGGSNGPGYGICCSPHGQNATGIYGFDCSGLVQYAYAQIGIPLARLAHDIVYNSGGQLIGRDFTQMQPGDVLGFSYQPGGYVFHVGIYIGNGQMVNADSNGVSIDSLTSTYYNRLAWRIIRFT